MKIAYKLCDRGLVLETLNRPLLNSSNEIDND